MAQELHPIHASIHCFLLPARDGFVLVDTGPAMSRRRLVREIERAGFTLDDLRLVVVTHGDVDHIGSCAYLQETFGTQIASHELEARAAETGDMQKARKAEPDRFPLIFKLLRPLGRFFDAEPFTPDILLEDGQSLTEFGVDATILHLPGHSKGSIGVLTAEGDLLCGDLFWNMRRPRLHSLIDDLEQARASVDRLRKLPIRRVYPAHGAPFDADEMP
jgi:hydroxyacylglutathione hydrolase